MAIEEESPAGTPEWMVTYSDMMSLLLTFFILLVSVSEVKKNDRFQGIADSIQHHFGHESARASTIPGESRPRNSELAALAVTGRSKRMSLLGLGSKNSGGRGPEPTARVGRPEEHTRLGTAINFAEGAVELSQTNHNELRAASEIWQGTPQNIEIRGHASRQPTPRSERVEDNWDLAYERCRQTASYLVNGLKIDPARIRIAVAPSYEPSESLVDSQQFARTDRIEVFLLEADTEHR